MARLSASEVRQFAAAFLETMDPARAAAAIGQTDGAALLERPEVQQQVQRQRAALQGVLTKEDVLRCMARLAFGRANDCVRLALDTEADVSALDLTLLSEIKRSDKGAVEIKLVDRLRVLEQLSALMNRGGSEAAEFFRAMEQMSGEEQKEDEEP